MDALSHLMRLPGAEEAYGKLLMGAAPVPGGRFPKGETGAPLQPGSLAVRALDVLRDTGGWMSARQVSEATGEKQENINHALYRASTKGLVEKRTIRTHRCEWRAA